MDLFRICRAAHRALDGEGARLYGGRWNSPGRPMVYTSSALSLAALEYLVHVSPEDAPRDLVAIRIDLPDDEPVRRLPSNDLPTNWQLIEPPECREIGDSWALAGNTLAFIVPSAPIPEESNVLINPLHAGARRIRVVSERAFEFDPRLLE